MAQITPGYAKQQPRPKRKREPSSERPSPSKLNTASTSKANKSKAEAEEPKSKVKTKLEAWLEEMRDAETAETALWDKNLVNEELVKGDSGKP